MYDSRKPMLTDITEEIGRKLLVWENRLNFML